MCSLLPAIFGAARAQLGCIALASTPLLTVLPEVASARIDPTGIWNCVVYGFSAASDERIVLKFESGGTTQVAIIGSRTNEWLPLSGWETNRRELTFHEARTGRSFAADLDYTTLGGTWNNLRRSGGWWCAQLLPELASRVDDLLARERFLMPPLIPDVMATPWYPRRAIREAKEGSAVICFLVETDGVIKDPQVVEISDEIFRVPAVGAVTRSRYAGWSNAVSVRPGCRSFDFHLDAVAR